MQIFSKKKLASASAVANRKIEAKFNFDEPQVGFEKGLWPKIELQLRSTV